ncbi:MAG: hypothetical protein E7163_00070 [Firmicutes bacterium]|nr:hypothetical protein [Bacillota bacterium]
MKINYPVKYAAMPIIEQVGWSHGLHELEREYDIVCYIVSKCYLINDKTIYAVNGKTTKAYEVVFPYQSGKFRCWKRVIPEYNLIHGHCVNSNIVERVFDNYEEANDYIKPKNEQLCEKTWVYLPITDDIMDRIQDKKDAYNEKLSIYKALEQEILLNLNDMNVGNTILLNDVVKIENNKARIMSCDVYEVLNLFDDKKFVVYSISQEQYTNLIRMIDENQIEDINSIIVNAKGLIVHKAKNEVIKLAIDQDCGAYYIINNTIKYDSKMVRVTKDDFENIDEDTLVFYTTETIDDLLISYSEHPMIDLNEVEGIALKRVKRNY